jgi:hypothetical protein
MADKTQGVIADLEGEFFLESSEVIGFEFFRDLKDQGLLLRRDEKGIRP